MKLQRNSIEKILLKGYYGFGNFGDDLLMLVAYRLLQSYFPQAKISIFSNFNERLSGFNRQPNYNHYILTIIKCEAELTDWTKKANYDLIVNGGGGVFFDRSHGGLAFTVLNFISRRLGIQNVHRLDRWIRRIFKKSNRLTSDLQIGLGIGIGPYSRDAKLLMRHMTMLGDFNILGVRDKKSARFLVDHKFPGLQMDFMDLAFLTAYWHPTRSVQKEKVYTGKIGIILQDFPHDILEKFDVIKQFVKQLEGVDVTFFSFDHNHDVAYTKEFAAYNFITWHPDKNEMTVFLDALGSMDVVISARAHGVIIGAILGVVPISLGISQKLVEVSKYFPKGGMLVEEPFAVSSLVACLDNVIVNYEQHQSFLVEEVDANSRAAMQAKEKLFSE